jgi:hypothetical protein
MLESCLPAVRPGIRKHRILVVLGLCALLQAAAADALRSEFSPTTLPAYGATEKSMPLIRIKRLRPADPESTEVMLATRGLIPSGSRVS